jgi:hypothetical protein
LNTGKSGNDVKGFVRMPDKIYGFYTKVLNQVK